MFPLNPAPGGSQQQLLSRTTTSSQPSPITTSVVAYIIKVLRVRVPWAGRILPPRSAARDEIDGAEYASTPSPTTKSTPINVVLFGETGVGKSSVVNLIAQEKIAKVSSGVDGCTMESTPYNISFDGMDFTIFDTIGLEEPEIGVNGYLKAIEKAFELITRLKAAGGIHLLLFCIRAGRMTATTQSNYRLFYERLCRKKVPIALVFTGLEREANPEDWWTEHYARVEQHFGIRNNGHACITAVHNGTPDELDKYNESREKVRDLIKTCALDRAASLPEAHSWFAMSAKGMMSFIKKRLDPGKKHVKTVLTQQCNLAPDVAQNIVDMMGKIDRELNEKMRPSVWEVEGGRGRNPTEGYVKDQGDDAVHQAHRSSTYPY